MIPHCISKRIAISAGLLIALLMTAGSSYAKHKPPVEEPPFQYQAGTENIAKGCGGKLEVLKEAFAFHCPGGDLSIPYSTITLMQYRPDLSDEVMAMKVPWAYPPLLARVNKNKYFTIVSKDQGKLRVVVLRVDEKDMRPYFAEIELQSGKSVQEYRSYEEFQ
jgi:hypothetical protein